MIAWRRSINECLWFAGNRKSEDVWKSCTVIGYFTKRIECNTMQPGKKNRLMERDDIVMTRLKNIEK